MVVLRIGILVSMVPGVYAYVMLWPWCILVTRWPPTYEIRDGIPVQCQMGKLVVLSVASVLQYRTLTNCMFLHPFNYPS